MALTLPYPDMDFVPLDILTAAEQDQLVANIEYIANQFPVSSIASNAVDTAQIKDSAVTADKIDFTTITTPDFPIVQANTSNNNVNSSSWYNQYQYTIPETGVYLAIFSQMMTGGEAGRDFGVRLELDGVVLSKTASGGSTWVNYITAVAHAIFSANKNAILRCQSQGGGTNSYTTRGGQVSITRLR